MRCILAAALLALPLISVHAQQCPKEDAKLFSIPSASRTLEGILIYHNGIRKWFELKFDKPDCDQPSVQLISSGDDRAPLEVLRGCRVRSKGVLEISPTGYYSLDTYQSVEKIEAAAACPPQPPLAKAPKTGPDPKVRSYRVDMHLDLSPGNHPIWFNVTNGGKPLRPWHAYASYFLTGGLVLYGDCGKGFQVDKVSGPTVAMPSHFTKPGDPGDRAMFDAEGDPDAGITNLHLTYTCIRAH